MLFVHGPALNTGLQLAANYCFMFDDTQPKPSSLPTYEAYLDLVSQARSCAYYIDDGQLLFSRFSGYKNNKFYFARSRALYGGSAGTATGVSSGSFACHYDENYVQTSLQVQTTSAEQIAIRFGSVCLDPNPDVAFSSKSTAMLKLGHERGVERAAPIYGGSPTFMPTPGIVCIPFDLSGPLCSDLSRSGNVEFGGTSSGRAYRVNPALEMVSYTRDKSKWSATQQGEHASIAQQLAYPYVQDTGRVIKGLAYQMTGSVTRITGLTDSRSYSLDKDSISMGVNPTWMDSIQYNGGAGFTGDGGLYVARAGQDTEPKTLKWGIMLMDGAPGLTSFAVLSEDDFTHTEATLPNVESSAPVSLKLPARITRL